MAKIEQSVIKEFEDDVNEKYDDRKIPIDEIHEHYAIPIQAFISYMNDVAEDYDTYSSLVSYYDQARLDILHYLELIHTSAPERSKLTSKLIEISKYRRIAKNYLHVCQAIMDMLITPSLVKYTKDLQDVIKHVNKVKTGTYTPRTIILNDIFPDYGKNIVWDPDGIETEE